MGGADVGLVIGKLCFVDDCATGGGNVSDSDLLTCEICFALDEGATATC